MVAARARVLANPGVDALRAWVAEPESTGFASLGPLRQASVLYGAALASLRQRDFVKARALAVRLTAAVSADAAAARLAQLLSAEIEAGAGDAQRASQLLGENLATRPALLLAAQVRTQLGQAGSVAPRLQAWVATHPRDATAWMMLSGTYAAQGQMLRSIRADAEARAAHLDYAAARDRLKAAQEMVRRGEAGKAPGDHIEISIIDARLRQVESTLREQALER